MISSCMAAWPRSAVRRELNAINIRSSTVKKRSDPPFTSSTFLRPMAFSAGTGCADFFILNTKVCAASEQEIHYGPMTIVGSVVQSGAGVIEPAGNCVDLRAFVQQQVGRGNVPADAGVYKRIVHDALPIVLPGSESRRQRF